jgi:hypothetical protein
MKTAVEYLAYVYALQGAIYQDDIDKAKEMEEEQIEKAVDDYFMEHIRRTTTMHEVIIKDGDIIRFDDSKHEKKYDDLKERNGRFG